MTGKYALLEKRATWAIHTMEIISGLQKYVGFRLPVIDMSFVNDIIK
jgi:hypothetical protein